MSRIYIYFMEKKIARNLIHLCSFKLPESVPNCEAHRAQPKEAEILKIKIDLIPKPRWAVGPHDLSGTMSEQIG